MQRYRHSERPQKIKIFCFIIPVKGWLGHILRRMMSDDTQIEEIPK